MRASRAGIVACSALGVTFALIACGGGGSSEDAATTAAPDPGLSRPAASAGPPCGTELPRFVRSLDGLRDQLAAGLAYDSYLEQVRKLQRAYRGIPVGEEPAACVVAVGIPAEKALNQNIEATNTWGNCLAARSCRVASVEPEIKRRWIRASVLITDAQEGLNRRAPGG
jgi:hypothetical protein